MINVIVKCEGICFFFLQMTKKPGHVCEETENIVSSCHVASELDQKMIPRKCSEVCGDFEGLYEYHCMRDSLKTNFIAICAIPKRLFGN